MDQEPEPAKAMGKGRSKQNGPCKMPGSSEILGFSHRKSEKSECGGGYYIHMQYTILNTMWLMLLDYVFLTEKQIGGVKLKESVRAKHKHLL